MNVYTIRTEVLSAVGVQTWTVTAESPEAALADFHAGHGVFAHEEFEVQKVGEPEIICEEIAS